MTRSSRVQSVARLAYRGSTQNRSSMVKRVRKTTLDPLITTSDAQFKTAIKPKANQAWRYPGGVIQRAISVHLNGSAKAYYDHIDTDQPRRKQESNFFVTINTNRESTESNLEVGQDAMKKLVDHLSKDAVVCTYMKS